AVHSLKDLPTIIPEGLTITATPEREDPRDALVLRADADAHNASLKNLSEGATVGTSSLRRIAQLKHLRPDVRVKDLRGNVDTRLRKLDAGEFDAVILASAGLRRLDGLVASLDGARVLRDSIEGDAADASAVGEALAARMIERGAASLLAEAPEQMNG